MAPEYAMDGKYSVKSDIFSLGVILLEIIIGKNNRGYGDPNHCLNLLGHVHKYFDATFINMNIVKKLTWLLLWQAWLLWKENRIVVLMDECLKNTVRECKVKRCMQVALIMRSKICK